MKFWRLLTNSSPWCEHVTGETAPGVCGTQNHSQHTEFISSGWGAWHWLIFFVSLHPCFLESNEKVLSIIVPSKGIFDIVHSDNKWRIMPRVKTKLSSEKSCVPFPRHAFHFYKQFAPILLSTKKVKQRNFTLLTRWWVWLLSIEEILLCSND